MRPACRGCGGRRRRPRESGSGTPPTGRPAYPAQPRTPTAGGGCAGAWGCAGGPGPLPTWPEPGCLWGQAPRCLPTPSSRLTAQPTAAGGAPGQPGSQGSWHTGRRDPQGSNSPARMLPGTAHAQGHSPTPHSAPPACKAHLVSERCTRAPSGLRVCSDLEPTHPPTQRARGPLKLGLEAAPGPLPSPQRGKSRGRPR